MRNNKKLSKKSKSFSKRLVLPAIVLTSIAAGVLSLNSNTYNQRTEISNGLRSPSQVVDITKRQAYLDKLIQDSDLPLCEGVIYDHGGVVLDYSRQMIRRLASTDSTIDTSGLLNAMESTISKDRQNGFYSVQVVNLPSLRGKGSIRPIFVGRDFFDNEIYGYITGNDLKHILTVHEYKHVEQEVEGFSFVTTDEIITGLNSGSIRNKILKALGELEAYIVEMDSIDRDSNGLSFRYISTSRNIYAKTKIFLEDSLTSASSLERRMIEHVLENAN